MFKALLVVSGRDPARFAVIEEAGGVVRVESGDCAVRYDAGSWVSRFGRDLYRDVFGPLRHLENV
jgi:hypothetical protein